MADPRGYHRAEVDAAVARMQAIVADAGARVAAIEASTEGLELQVAHAQGQVREIVRPSRTGLGQGVDRLFTGGASFAGLADGAYLTLSSDAAVDATRRLLGATVIPVHTDSWAHFTTDQDHTHAAFAAAGLEHQVTVLHRGDSVSLGR